MQAEFIENKQEVISGYIRKVCQDGMMPTEGRVWKPILLRVTKIASYSQKTEESLLIEMWAERWMNRSYGEGSLPGRGREQNYGCE